MSRFRLRASALALVLTLLPGLATAEWTMDPTTRAQVDLRLQYMPVQGTDTAFGTHVGRVRARIPMAGETLELIVPWTYYDVVADGIDGRDGLGLGNVTLGGGLALFEWPVRLGVFASAPTADGDPSSDYAATANYVEELELYAGDIDFALRTELQGEWPLFGHGHAALRLGYVAMSPADDDVVHDLVWTLGTFVENDVYLHGAELAFRSRLSEVGDGASATDADLVLTTGREIGHWRPSLQLRIPFQDWRQEATRVFAGLQLSYFP